MQLSGRLVTKCLVASAAATASSGLVLGAPAFAATVVGSTSSPSITTIAGNGTAGYGGDGGPAVNAELNVPTGISVDQAGSLYIGDSVNNRVRKVVSPTSINADVITTLAGNGTRGFSGDGGPATAAELAGPTGTATDASGDVFIADTGNNRVREVLPSGTIRTVAGSGVSCLVQKLTSASIGDGGPALGASLCAPSGVAVDSQGSLYISDSGHNEVRVVGANGIISDYAGTAKCGSSGDGGLATKAKLCGPTGIAFDATTNLYVADTGNSEVREVTRSDGKIRDFAGTAGTPGFSGDGGPATQAELNGPTGVGISSLGAVYISDTLNDRIRQVQSGAITTYAGNGTPGFSGDNGPATSAELNKPTGSVAMDGTALYFSDTANQRVRGVFTGPLPVLPDSSLAIALPLTGAVVIIGAGGILWLRRRRQAVAA